MDIYPSPLPKLFRRLNIPLSFSKRFMPFVFFQIGELNIFLSSIILIDLDLG
jgi:hypothetical protein